MDVALDYIDSFPESLLALDLNGGILRASSAAASLLNIKACELTGCSLMQLAADSKQHLESCLKLWAGSISYATASLQLRKASGEFVMVAGDGARYPGGAGPVLLLRLRVHGDLSGQSAALEAEVTRRLRVEQQLLEVDKRKDEFLAMLAHELRNPLTPIANSLQLLRLSSDPLQALDNCQAMMERQVRQLTRIVDDLFEVSRWTRGITELQRQIVSLSGIVQDAIATSKPLIATAGHSLELKLPPHELFVYGDSERLVQAVSNLLNNAAKYTPSGGRVELAVDAEDGCVRLQVTDTGVGIAPLMLEKIFDLFTRADGSLEQASGGLGIGLTLVKQIVEAHGGTVNAFSEGNNRGSRFIVRLPLHQQAYFPMSDAGPARPSPSLMGLRVLIVDDNRDAANSMAVMLGILGNDVQAVYGGHEAISAVTAFAPEVIFLDIAMPGMNGYETCRRIRTASRDRRPVIIALTGFGRQNDRLHTREKGFDEYLVKPVSMEALQAVLAANFRHSLTASRQ